MSKPPANSAVAPIKSSAIRGDVCSNFLVSWKVGRCIAGRRMSKVFIGSRHQTSPLVEAFKPFSEFAFT